MFHKINSMHHKLRLDCIAHLVFWSDNSGVTDENLDPIWSLSGVPDYFDRNKISSGGDVSHYSSASLY